MKPLARISVVAVRDRAKAEAFAAAHPIGKVCDRYRDVVSHEKVNAVYNPLHQLDAFITAVKKGVPLYTNGDDAGAQITVLDRCLIGTTKPRVCLSEAWHANQHSLGCYLIQ